MAPRRTDSCPKIGVSQIAFTEEGRGTSAGSEANKTVPSDLAMKVIPRRTPLRQGSTDLVGDRTGDAGPCLRIVVSRNDGVLKLENVSARFLDREARQS
jgi:hypothetical protein